MVHRELTAAIFLVVKVVFFDDFQASLAQSALAPILSPECHIGVMRRGKNAGFFNLFKAFPTARSKGGCYYLKAMFLGVFCRSQQPVFEAFKAAPSPFGLILQANHFSTPFFVVIVVVNDVESERLGIARAFVFSNLVFFLRIDVRITVIYSRCNAMLHQAFDDSRRARGAAGVQKHLRLPSRSHYLKLLFHGLKVIKMTAITAITSPM